MEKLYILCDLCDYDNIKIHIQLEKGGKKPKDFEDRFLKFNSRSTMWCL